MVEHFDVFKVLEHGIALMLREARGFGYVFVAVKVIQVGFFYVLNTEVFEELDVGFAQ